MQNNWKDLVLPAMAVMLCLAVVVPPAATAEDMPGWRPDMPGWTPYMPGVNGNPIDGTPPANYGQVPAGYTRGPVYYGQAPGNYRPATHRRHHH